MNMTVQELIDRLKCFRPEIKVLIENVNPIDNDSDIEILEPRHISLDQFIIIPDDIIETVYRADSERGTRKIEHQEAEPCILIS